MKRPSATGRASRRHWGRDDVKHHCRPLETMPREFLDQERTSLALNGRLTMHFFQPLFTRNTRCRVFMEWAEVSMEVEQLANGNVLVTEDCGMIEY